MIRALCMACCLPGAGAAQSIAACDDFRSSAFSLAEPWEKNTRLFANGAVRLAITDTLEPAVGAYHLIVLSPPYNEIGDRQCSVVTGDDGTGLAGLTLDGIEADYDPATGLRFRIAATRWLADSDSFEDSVLTVTVDQSNGVVTAEMD